MSEKLFQTNEMPEKRDDEQEDKPVLRPTLANQSA